MSQLPLVMGPKAQVFLFHPQPKIPIITLLYPIFVIFSRLFRPDKILYLHLLKFPGAEGDISRCYFVTERLANLGNAKRQFLPEDIHYIKEVDEYPLGSLRPQIGQTAAIFNRALMSLKHQIKGPGFG